MGWIIERCIGNKEGFLCRYFLFELERFDETVRHDGALCASLTELGNIHTLYELALARRLACTLALTVLGGITKPER
jgi:hypothetical protein